LGFSRNEKANIKMSQAGLSKSEVRAGHTYSVSRTPRVFDFDAAATSRSLLSRAADVRREVRERQAA
jgi:hypothetical protein